MLDQKFELTVDAIDRDYNLITFDKMQTKRIATFTDGSSELEINHDVKQTSSRHLVKVVDILPATELLPEEMVQVHLVVQCSKNTAAMERAVDLTAAITAKLTATDGELLRRILMLES